MHISTIVVNEWSQTEIKQGMGAGPEAGNRWAWCGAPLLASRCLKKVNKNKGIKK